MPDGTNHWIEDERQIMYVVTTDGRRWPSICYGFERIQHNGEYCYLPWLRITRHESVVITEVPLTSVARIDFIS